ncbi:MAG: hypothetical protein RL523_670 [Actinomycetota bacterium]|jgi:hypothetical protein
MLKPTCYWLLAIYPQKIGVNRPSAMLETVMDPDNPDPKRLEH